MIDASHKQPPFEQFNDPRFSVRWRMINPSNPRVYLVRDFDNTHISLDHREIKALSKFLGTIR